MTVPEAIHTYWCYPDKVNRTETADQVNGEFVNFDPMIARPKPIQKPHWIPRVSGRRCIAIVVKAGSPQGEVQSLVDQCLCDKARSPQPLAAGRLKFSVALIGLVVVIAT
jgi:hypothetical protein